MVIPRALGAYLHPSLCVDLLFLVLGQPIGALRRLHFRNLEDDHAVPPAGFQQLPGTKTMLLANGRDDTQPVSPPFATFKDRNVVDHTIDLLILQRWPP